MARLPPGPHSVAQRNKLVSYIVPNCNPEGGDPRGTMLGSLGHH